jgi:hypothetical protein
VKEIAMQLTEMKAGMTFASLSTPEHSMTGVIHATTAYRGSHISGGMLSLAVASAGRPAFYTRETTKLVCLDGTEREDSIRRAVKAAVEKEGLHGAQGPPSGTDPELFVLDGKGVVIPAFDFLPSQAERGLSFAYWDGFQAEMWVQQQCCHAFLVDNIATSLHNLRAQVILHDPKATLSTASVVDISPKMMAATSQEHSQLGCSPSYNVYGERPLQIEDSRKLPYRFAGCHIHQGYGPMTDWAIEQVVTGLDSILGIVMTSLFRGMEDIRRREFYGRAGEFRLPPHGLEYRVPSAAVLAHPVLAHLVFDLARVVGWMAITGTLDRWKGPSSYEVRRIINELDADSAAHICEKNRQFLVALANGVWPKADSTIVTDLIIQGATSQLDVSDLAKNWRLTAKNTPWGSHSASTDCSIATYRPVGQPVVQSAATYIFTGREV